jgi:hypothetical protein
MHGGQCAPTGLHLKCDRPAKHGHHKKGDAKLSPGEFSIDAMAISYGVPMPAYLSDWKWS